jgi:phosphohistidine swiveling domain-containing protein
MAKSLENQDDRKVFTREIAREMNKSCIIGTKIATNILKNGDEIEVDADNGIVKILNK